MTIINFIREINESLPTSDQIISKYSAVIDGYDAEMAKEYLKDNVLKFEDTGKAVDIADELVYNTNIGSIGIGVVNFFSQVNVVQERYKELASYNDSCYICYDTKDDLLVIFDEYYEEKELLATSMEQFLQFLVEYHKYHRYIIFGVDYSRDQSRQIITSLINQGLEKKWVKTFMPNW